MKALLFHPDPFDSPVLLATLRLDDGCLTVEPAADPGLTGDVALTFRRLRGRLALVQSFDALPGVFGPYTSLSDSTNQPKEQQ